MNDLINRSELLKEIEKYKFGAISNDAEREYIKKASQNKDLSKEEKQSQIEKIKDKSKTAQKETDAAYKKAVEHGGATKELEELNKASLILRDGIARFNAIGSILASLIGVVINQFKGSEEMDKAIESNLPGGVGNLPLVRHTNKAVKGLYNIGAKGQSYREGKAVGMIYQEGHDKFKKDAQAYREGKAVNKTRQEKPESNEKHKEDEDD